MIYNRKGKNMKHVDSFKIFESKKNWLGQEYSIEIPDRDIDKHTKLWVDNKINFKIDKNTWDKKWTSATFNNKDDFRSAYNLSKEKELEENKAEFFGQDWKKTDYIPGWLTGWGSLIKKGHGMFGYKNMKKIAPFFGVPN